MGGQDKFDGEKALNRCHRKKCSLSFPIDKKTQPGKKECDKKLKKKRNSNRTRGGGVVVSSREFFVGNQSAFQQNREKKKRGVIPSLMEDRGRVDPVKTLRSHYASQERIDQRGKLEEGGSALV